jgi:hypothetical protein
VTWVARFTDWFADEADAIVHRTISKSDAIELTLFAILAIAAIAAVAGIVLIGVWMVQQGNWAYLPLLLVFFVVPVAVWRIR